MLVIAKQEITITFIKDIVSVTRYYILQSSEPSAPTTNPPPAGWSDTEPSYTSDDANALYFCDLTIFSDGTWKYSNVSKSSSFEAVNDCKNTTKNLSETVTDQYSTIQKDIGSINMTVGSLKETITTNADNSKEQIATLEKQVKMCMTESSVDIKIQTELQNGVTSLDTTTGITFNENGLNISKSNAPTNTRITENGMTIHDTNGDTLLAANNAGVTAKNLHATTYLIIGTNIRFENYERNGVKRAGCFWVEVD